MNKIRCGDTVQVLTGKDKGRQGVVKQVLIDKQVKNNVTSRTYQDRVLVEGINIVKKHVKPNPNVQETGGVKEFEKSIDISNVAFVDPDTGKPTRIGFKILEDGTKVRISKKTQKEV